MADSPTRFPLAWPSHKPRTDWRKRQNGQFRANEKPITRVEAVRRLDAEVGRLGGRYALLSSDLELRLDGQPHLGKAEAADPGVCLYFSLDGKPFAMACDTYTSLAQNIAAIAAHIEATRRIARYGVATAAETLQAFSALPPPSGPSAPPTRRPWRDVLGFTAGFWEGLSPAEAEGVVGSRYRNRAKAAAGNDAAILELNLARDAALAEIRAKQGAAA